MGFVGGMVNLTISIILATGLVIPTILNANTSEWGTAEASLWGFMVLAVVVGLVVGTFQIFGLV